MEPATILLGVGGLLIAAGLFSLMLGKAGAQSGIKAFEKVGIDAPAWLMLCIMGTGLILVATMWNFADSGPSSPPTTTTTTTTSTTAPPPQPTAEFNDFEPFIYGDDPYLDALSDECAAGNWASCNTLYWDSPAGSAYENWGATCGGVYVDWTFAGSC